MIFKTFDSNADKWTTKIGTLGMSFHNLGTAISTSFKQARDAVRNPDNSTGFFKTFKDSLLSSTINGQDYKRNTAGEIVTRENIDTYIPTLDIENRKNKLADIKDIRNGSKTKDDFYSSLKPSEDYLRELIENTKDLSDLTGNDLVKANEKARASVLSQNEALKQQSIAAKASKAVIQTVATAGSMVAGLLITKGIELAVTAIDNLIHRQERLAEAAKTAAENIKNSYSSFSELKQSTGSITQEFAQLSQHVNQTTGENIDLPTEDYQRFLELSNQLAETFPNIGYTIDENGNKITGLSGSIDEITQSINDLVQAQQLLTHQEISDNMDDAYKKTWEDVKKYKNELEDLEKQKTDLPDVQEAVQKLLSGENLDFQIYTESDSQLFSDMTEMFQRADLKLNRQEGKIFLNMNAADADLSDKEIDKLLADADTITAKYSADNEDIDQQMADIQNKIQMSMNSFSPNLTSWLTTDQNYSDIVQSYGNDLGTAIQKSVQSIDLTDIDDKKWDGMESWITDNILAPLNNADNEKIRQAYIKLFTDTDLPLDSAMEYLAQIKEYYSEHNIEIPTVFTEQEENFTELQKKFKERNNSFQTGNSAELNTFFQENSIDEADEYEKWLSVTEGITDATKAMEAWKRATESTEETTPISFQESWNSLGTTGNDDSRQATQEAKEQLMELANAGKLTAEELQNSPAGKTIMEQTKLSAEEATEAVNALADRTSQLSTMKSGIQSISSVLAQKQENLGNAETKTTGIDSSTLSGFDASIKGLDSWKQFEETLGNGKSSMESCRQAANNLATEWINSNNFLSQLNDTNEEYYISQLQEMGVENARSIVSDIINQKKAEEAQKERDIALEKEYNKQSSIDLTQADRNQIDALGNYAGWTEETREALYRLALQKQIANGVHLNTQEDINQLISLVEATGGTAKALKAWKNYNGSGGTNKAKELWQAAVDEAEDSATTGNSKEDKKKPKTVKISPVSTKSPSGSNGNNNNTTPKETKRSFDWLERRISVLTSKLDFLKAKLENVFSVQQKNSLIDQEIKKTNTLINTYKKQEKFYKAQANKSAKSDKDANDNDKAKLTGKEGAKLKKLIQTGQIKGSKKQWIQEYDGKTANAIEDYQNYWDKYQTARKNRLDAIKSKRELKIQKHQNWVDYYDSIGSQYDARIESASTAKTKNDLEKDKLGYIKKSYNQQIKIAKLEDDSVKAATLLAQKWKEIADTRERILQSQLDENADKRDYNNAAYENADIAGKKSLIQKNIATYNNDNDAYAKNVNSAQKTVKETNSDVSKKAKAVSSQMKKDGLNKSTMKEIQSYLSSGKKIPDEYLNGTKVMLPKLYKKLVDYNNSIDAAELASEALAKAQEDQQKALEENKTAKREEKSKSIQLDIDAASNRKDRLAAEYNNLTKTEDKNANIDSQWLQQFEIHNKTIEHLKNDITDATELADALAKEEAEWLSTWREMEVLKLQNLADEESAQYELNQQLETGANLRFVQFFVQT